MKFVQLYMTSYTTGTSSEVDNGSRNAVVTTESGVTSRPATSPSQSDVTSNSICIETEEQSLSRDSRKAVTTKSGLTSRRAAPSESGVASYSICTETGEQTISCDLISRQSGLRRDVKKYNNATLVSIFAQPVSASNADATRQRLSASVDKEHNMDNSAKVLITREVTSDEEQDTSTEKEWGIGTEEERKAAATEEETKVQWKVATKEKNKVSTEEEKEVATEEEKEVSTEEEKEVATEEEKEVSTEEEKEVSTEEEKEMSTEEEKEMFTEEEKEMSTEEEKEVAMEEEKEADAEEEGEVASRSSKDSEILAETDGHKNQVHSTGRIKSHPIAKKKPLESLVFGRLSIMVTVVAEDALLLPLRSPALADMLDNPHVYRSIALRCACELIYTRRIIVRKLVRWTRYAVLLLRGPTVTALKCLRAQLEAANPAFIQAIVFDAEKPRPRLLTAEHLPDNLALGVCSERTGRSEANWERLRVDMPNRAAARGTNKTDAGRPKKLILPNNLPIQRALSHAYPDWGFQESKPIPLTDTFEAAVERAAELEKQQEAELRLGKKRAASSGKSR